MTENKSGGIGEDIFKIIGIPLIIFGPCLLVKNILIPIGLIHSSHMPTNFIAYIAVGWVFGVVYLAVAAVALYIIALPAVPFARALINIIKHLIGRSNKKDNVSKALSSKQVVSDVEKALIEKKEKMNEAKTMAKEDLDWILNENN